MSYQFIVVDDEPLARKLICSHATKIGGLESAGECGDALEAASMLRIKSVDLIFLDIQMPELNGLDFLQTLKRPPSVIFTTAYREFAPEAFDVDAIDYLIKPISFERFLKAVNKFFDRCAATSNVTPTTSLSGDKHILIKADRKVHKIFQDEIFFIESLDVFVKIHLKDRILISRENITSLEARLDRTAFVRVHRSYIVATKWVLSISSDGVEIAGKILPFGRTFKLSALANLGVLSSPAKDSAKNY